MRSVFLLFLMVFAATFVNADGLDAPFKGTDANLHGHVVDKRSGEHVAFVTIALKGTTLGTMTDATGHYYLTDLPDGKFTIIVSGVGYKTIEQEVILKRGIAEEVNFEIEEDMIALDETVVSANRSETKRRLAPTLVKVLDGELFAKVNAVSLADGLHFQPGVRVENTCQNCGSSQVRINGLDGPYTQIMVDSRPVFSALASVYGLEQVPTSMIDRVEVMRGGGSALFGSSAIAGTINIITKEPSRNTALFSHNITSLGGNGDFDNVSNFNASLITDDYKAGMYVFGQSRNRSAYDRDDDGFSDLPELESRSIGMKSFLKTGTYGKITAEYHTINEYRRGGDKLDRPAHEADIAEMVDHSINSGNVKYDYYTPNERSFLSVYSSIQNIDRDSYYGAGQDPNAYGSANSLTLATGVQFVTKFNKVFFMPSDLTIGSEYVYDNMKDIIVGRNRDFEQSTNNIGTYLQNEWKNEQWSILLGGRLDKHSELSSPVFSPRINIRFNPTDKVNIRASYSSGFRAPQVFDEDLHINLLGGGKLAQIVNSDNLKKERSNSYSLSADWYATIGGVNFNLLLEGFYTRLDDVFATSLTDDKINSDVYVMLRTNDSGAEVMGMNFEARAIFTKWFELQFGGTLQKSEYLEPVEWSENASPETEMFRTPNAYGYFTATFQPLKNMSAYVMGNYTGDMLIQHYGTSDVAVRTPDFFEMEMKVAYKMPFYKTTSLELSAGVKNIFDAYQSDLDTGADRDPSYIYGPSLPRSFFAGLKLMF